MCSMGKLILKIIRESASEFISSTPTLKTKDPGFGRPDFKPISAALKEVSYDGVVSVEV